MCVSDDVKLTLQVAVFGASLMNKYGAIFFVLT